MEREPRPITIHDLSLLTYRKKTLLFEVTCSKGTFIRTLCEDIAKKLAMEGTMSFLLRTKVGGLHLGKRSYLGGNPAGPLWDRSFIGCGAASFSAS